MGTLPDCRDGLDAVRRAVLSRLGDDYTVCEDVVGDAPSYQALVELAQEFRTRYPLVDGRGNFGSIDGDPPADPEHTEARSSALAGALTRFPNLLVNGSSGIPPHNMREVAAAVNAYIEESGIGIAELMTHIPGPDFPTGGVIVDPAVLRPIYETGTGAIDLRARSHVDGDAIVVTELPFGIDKGGEQGVIRQIAELSAGGSLTELRDLRDESDDAGIRIVVSLRGGANPHAALEKLLAHTALQSTLHVEFVALVEGAPRRITLSELIARFLDTGDAATARHELHAISAAFGDDRRTVIGS